MPLLHFTMARLAPGSIIQAGNWGRLLRRYENDKGPTGQQYGLVWVLTRELVFELERERGFKTTKPSRFNATFCFNTRADADAYRALNDIHFTQVLHEVEHVDPAVTKHEGSVDLTKWPPGGAPFLPIMTDQAQAYWRGDGAGVREVLSESALRVVACLE